MKKQLPVASSQLPDWPRFQVELPLIDWIDRWAQPLCTALLIIGAAYIVGHLAYAACLGRLVVR